MLPFEGRSCTVFWDLFKHLAPYWVGFGGPVPTCYLDDLPRSVSG